MGMWCDLLGKTLGSLLLCLFATAALVLSRGSTLLLVAQIHQKDLPHCGTPVCDREEVSFHFKIDSREVKIDINPRVLLFTLSALS